MTMSILQRGESAHTARGADGFQKAAEPILDLVRIDQTGYVPPRPVIIDTLESVDSEHQQQVIASILKHVDAVAPRDVDAAIRVASVAADFAEPGSEFERQAVASCTKHLHAYAVRDTAAAVDLAKLLVLTCKGPSSELQHQVLPIILEYLKPLAMYDTLEAYKAVKAWIFTPANRGVELFSNSQHSFRLSARA